ncbi:MAG: hypothetical protein R3230_00195 [Nitrosopumilaceae archaeon]|nr:hypothetical protein [Nitrosopumilaceae archaeon]
MAVSPSKLKRFSEQELKDFETRIDDALKRKYIDENGTIDVIVSGEPSQELRGALSKVYFDAGWKRVVISTSSDNGERPGLTQVTLYS